MARKKTSKRRVSAKTIRGALEQKSSSLRSSKRRQSGPGKMRHVPDSLVAEAGYYAAHAELLEQLGGYEAMLAPARVSRRLKEQNNLVGVAIGLKKSAGRYTGDLAIKVFVRKKAAKSRVRSNALVPERFNGYATDVVETGVVRAFSGGGGTPFPIPCGEPIANVHGVEEGTLGCLIEVGGKTCLLSCNHVIANLGVANVGDQIVFQDPETGILTEVATLLAWGALALDDATTINQCDVAIADLTLGAVRPELIGTPLTPPGADAPDGVRFPVSKSGANGKTYGIVDSIHASTTVTLTGRVGNQTVSHQALFKEQLFITGSSSARFCESGDSGSVILFGGTNQPVGLLFSGLDNGDCFANPILAVCNTLRVGLDAFDPLSAT